MPFVQNQGIWKISSFYCLIRLASHFRYICRVYHQPATHTWSICIEMYYNGLRYEYSTFQTQIHSHKQDIFDKNKNKSQYVFLLPFSILTGSINQEAKMGVMLYMSIASAIFAICFLGHRSQRLQWPIVIMRCPSSVVRPSVRRPSVRLFTFSTSSPEPLDGFWWKLVWMKYSRSLTSVVVFRPDPPRGGSRAGPK